MRAIADLPRSFSLWFQRAGRQQLPAGDVGPLKLGELDLGSFVAFRPSAAIREHPDGALGVLGLNLLKHLRLTIDRKSRTAVCRVSAPPEFPVADRDYFKAMVADDTDQLEAWLEKYPKERLSQEAAQRLLGYRIDEDAGPEQIEMAIRRLRATWREDMVSTQALELMKDPLNETLIAKYMAWEKENATEQICQKDEKCRGK